MNKVDTILFNVSTLFILTGIIGVLGYSAWTDYSVVEFKRAIMEFMLFVFEVIFITHCIYSIKESKRNNWE